MAEQVKPKTRFQQRNQKNYSNPDYQQVEHIINESRVRQRQEKVKQVVNPTAVTMSVSKQLTAVMRAEAHILYRMMEHTLVLNDYRLRDDFVFETPEFQILYGLLIDNGSITSEDLANQTREVENAWYQVLALDLPSEMSPEELKEVEESRNRALLNQQNLQIKKKVQEASHVGDTDTALEELERLIAQKRRME